jgi:hypothetical protein
VLCPVLHRIAFPVVSEWYQVKSGDSGLRVAGFFAIQMCQMLRGPPNRRGEAPTRDFHLHLRFPSSFPRMDIHAGLTYVALTSTHRIGTKRSSGEPNKRSMQNTGYRFRRIYLPRTLVNKGLLGRQPVLRGLIGAQPQRRRQATSSPLPSPTGRRARHSSLSRP